MNIALVVVTDGRWRYLERALQAAARYLHHPSVKHRRIVNDSGEHLGWPDFEIVNHPQRRGLAAAVASAWADLPDDADYVFHLEEDFVLTEPVPLVTMAAVLASHTELAQLVLKRQPWSPEERAAGGIIERHPERYTERDAYVEHREIFSLNPSLIPRAITDRGWPPGNEAEMTAQLLADGYSFAFWGRAKDRPRCLHIGAERSPGWKL